LPSSKQINRAQESDLLSSGPTNRFTNSKQTPQTNQLRRVIQRQLSSSDPTAPYTANKTGAPDEHTHAAQRRHEPPLEEPSAANQATGGNYRDHSKARSGWPRRLATLGLAAASRAEWDEVEVLGWLRHRRGEGSSNPRKAPPGEERGSVERARLIIPGEGWLSEPDGPRWLFRDMDG
jgi:hypothetical protein